MNQEKCSEKKWTYLSYYKNLLFVFVYLPNGEYLSISYILNFGKKVIGNGMVYAFDDNLGGTDDHKIFTQKMF